MATITLEGKVVGQRAAFERVSLALEGTPDTLAALIETLVRAEVAAFNARQADAAREHVLSEGALARGALVGRIVSGGPRSDDADLRRADPDEAVHVARRAFEDGLYFVFVDDAQVHALTDPVRLRPDSTVLLLRLTALAGG